VPGNTPGLYAQEVLSLLARHGKDTADYLRRSKLLGQLPPDTALSEVEFTHDEYLQFIEELLENFDIPGLGLRIGRRFRVTDFGILGYALISTRTLADALKIAEKYQMLWGGSGRLATRFSIEGEYGVWEESSNLPPGKLQQFELEMAVAQSLCSRELLKDPQKFRLLKVQFSFPEPDYVALFEETFRCPLEFGREHTRVYFPKQLLEMELSSTNDLAQAVCEDQCQKLLRVLEDRGGLTEKVRTIILNAPGEMPQLKTVADSLNMSLRTLRRRLKSEDTTYSEIMTDVRMKIAKQYLLETPLSIKEIGYLLCYSEVANFQRAFKNWYQTTPSGMRKQNAKTN